MPHLVESDKRPVIFAATFEITKRCNLACLHCYRVEEPDRQELSTAEAKDVLDQMRALGAFSVYFTGGEAFGREDFLEIVAHARALRMNVTIASNAHFIDARVARELKRLAVLSVAISIYGATGPTHDRMTKQAGSWEKTLRGAEHLVTQGVVTVFRMIVTHFNHHEVPAVLDLCREKGIHHRLFPVLTTRTDGSREPLDLQAGPTEVSRAMRIVLDGARLPPLGVRPRPDDRGVRCGVSWSSCTVNPYGDVLPCLTMEFPAGNIRQDSLARVWNHSPVFTTLRTLRASDFDSCFSCDFRARCNSCIGKAYMENGSIFLPGRTTHCESTRTRSALYDALVQNAFVCPAHPPEGTSG